MHSFKEKAYKIIFGGLATTSVVCLVGIILTLILNALPLLKGSGLGEILLGQDWYPTSEPASFGMLPLIAASLLTTLGALIICVPIGVGSALYLNELAGNRQRAILKPAIEILAGIPSIVYGFFGMLIVAPALQNAFGLSTGLCAFTASLMLGIMATPTVCSISEDALSCVPRSFREASLALGANRWQTLMRVSLPAAGSGIATAVILGLSRAVGETMTVLMVAGGAAVIPKSLWEPVRPMTATIAAEMGEAVMGSPHFHALFMLGLILFVITLGFNIIAERISRRYRLKLGLGR